MPLLVPLAPGSGEDSVLDSFLSFCLEQGIELYPHQEEAILELFSGSNVILNTPTGSGKSLVATALQYQAICEGRRCYYTVPTVRPSLHRREPREKWEKGRVALVLSRKTILQRLCQGVQRPAPIP